MPDIRYVCLSDMHLGADNSVLTYIEPGSIQTNAMTDPLKTGPVLEQLVACLRELIMHNEGKQKPTLILNGDILEMALADTNVAAMTFERFIELAFPKDGEALFDKNIFYNPGNHDHHIWENGRETQYVKYLSSIPAGSRLDPPWHTTALFPPSLMQEYFLTNLIQRFPHLQDAAINIVYPNYGLLSDDGQKGVIFSHGHYVESIYSLMSTLNTLIFPDRQKPKVIYELEAENFAWIDFFWSTMGRSGGVGLDVDLLYDKLKDRRQIKKLLGNFSRSVLQGHERPKFLEFVEENVLLGLLELTLGRVALLERNQPALLLSPDAQRGLNQYIEGPLFEQIQQENQQPLLTTDLTFIFGHTHKPFSMDMNFSGYSPWTKVYNSGGWVVDSLTPAPLCGGAVILIDEMLQTISLRMYNEADAISDYAPRVEESRHPGVVGNSTFHDRISALVKPASDPWKTFSTTVAGEVPIRSQILQNRINQ